MRIWLLLIALLAIGSASVSAADNMVRAKVSVPIAAMPTDARGVRVIPWADIVLRAGANYQTDSKSPAAAAAARLRARDEVLANIARQLSKLPASEPPPGDEQDLNVRDFAARRSGMDDYLRSALEETSETATPGPNGYVILTRELPLDTIARRVLDSGGGFAPNNPLVLNIGPMQRAAQQAEEKAQSEVLQQLLAKKATSRTTYGDWVRALPGNRQILVQALHDDSKVTKRGREKNGDKDIWLMELEFDSTALQKIVKKQDDSIKKAKKSGQ
ncbi:hypothetical protein BH09SUM1_BH09SUM1_21510 [soil metagenome]